jgi:hypothetical protein
MAEHATTTAYQAPRIEDRTDIDRPLIGGAVGSGAVPAP